MKYDDALSRETFTHEGREFEMALFPDEDSGAPWKECDGHGEVEQISDRDAIPRGWTVLHDMRRGRWIYNAGGAIVKAAREKWGLNAFELARLTAALGKKPTRAQIRYAAVKIDMEHLRGWLADDWHYVGVSVRIIGPDGEPEGDDCGHALWGVESTGGYPLEVARELAGGILHERADAWRAALTEARARRYWASRDVVTVGVVA